MLRLWVALFIALTLLASNTSATPGSDEYSGHFSASAATPTPGTCVGPQLHGVTQSCGNLIRSGGNATLSVTESVVGLNDAAVCFAGGAQSVCYSGSILGKSRIVPSWATSYTVRITGVDVSWRLSVVH